jgi:YaiO family outer membrane protein
VLVACGSLLVSAGAAAQEAEAGAAPQPARWTTEVSAGATDAGAAGDWREGGVALRRKSAAGSIGLEWLWASRFDRTDHAAAIDAWVNASPRTYANLRYQHGLGDAGLFPERAWRAEVFHVLDGGWEVSAGYDRLEFATATLGITGVGFGRYWGNFYARARVARASGSASTDSTSVRAMLRWYYAGTGDEYFEVAGGSGRSAEDLAQLGGEARFRSDAASVAWLKSLGPAWSLRAGASYADDHGAGRIERGASLAVQRHW